MADRRDLFGRALTPGKHTLVFDFKYGGPGPGKGGTGVFTVDGKELANKNIAHTIPLMMTIATRPSTLGSIPARASTTATSCRSGSLGPLTS